MLVVPVGVVGAMACMAQVIARWQQYFLYRYTGAFGLSRWPDIQHHTVRLSLFVVLATALFISEQPVSLCSWPAAAILAWCIFLARKEIVSIIKEAHRIDTEARDVPLFSGGND